MRPDQSKNQYLKNHYLKYHHDVCVLANEDIISLKKIRGRCYIGSKLDVTRVFYKSNINMFCDNLVALLISTKTKNKDQSVVLKTLYEYLFLHDHNTMITTSKLADICKELDSRLPLETAVATISELIDKEFLGVTGKPGDRSLYPVWSKIHQRLFDSGFNISIDTKDRLMAFVLDHQTLIASWYPFANKELLKPIQIALTELFLTALAKTGNQRLLHRTLDYEYSLMKSHMEVISSLKNARQLKSPSSDNAEKVSLTKIIASAPWREWTGYSKPDKLGILSDIYCTACLIISVFYDFLKARGFSAKSKKSTTEKDLKNITSSILSLCKLVENYVEANPDLTKEAITIHMLSSAITKKLDNKEKVPPELTFRKFLKLIQSSDIFNSSKLKTPSKKYRIY